MELLESLARSCCKIEEDIGIVVQELLEDFLPEEVAERIFLCDDPERRRFAAQEGEEAEKISLIPVVVDLLPSALLSFLCQESDAPGADDVKKLCRRSLRTQDDFPFWKVFDDEGSDDLVNRACREEMERRHCFYEIPDLI